MPTLDRAIQITVEAHSGQKDKGGAPYILHPLRLMIKMRTDVERIVAILHDVVEDSKWSLDDLRREGFSDDVIQAVGCLTKQSGESYEIFIERILPHPLARTVKIADLQDNMDTGRIPNPSEKDRQRVAKYEKALATLVAGRDK